jgi:hypothetical protein
VEVIIDVLLEVDCDNFIRYVRDVENGVEGALVRHKKGMQFNDSDIKTVSQSEWEL